MLRAFGKGQRRVEDEAESARLMRLDHLQNVAVRAELELGPELELELGPRPPAERRRAPRHALTMTPNSISDPHPNPNSNLDPDPDPQP